MSRPRNFGGRVLRRFAAGNAMAAALCLALCSALAACSGGGGHRVHVDAIQAPPGTLRAVFFEFVAHCKKNAARASSAEPESSCTIEVVGASTLDPEGGRIVINRDLEVDHESSVHGDAWDEQGVELIAYGPNGSAAFSTRAWHDFEVWSPAKGPAHFIGDPRAAKPGLSEVERRSFALEPMAATIETLGEVPVRLRLDLKPFVVDIANLLEAIVVDPGLSKESRDRIQDHLALLDETMREWNVDWLARRGS